ERGGDERAVRVGVRVGLQRGRVAGHGRPRPPRLLPNQEPQLPPGHPGRLLAGRGVCSGRDAPQRRRDHPVRSSHLLCELQENAAARPPTHHLQAPDLGDRAEQHGVHAGRLPGQPRPAGVPVAPGQPRPLQLHRQSGQHQGHEPCPGDGRSPAPRLRGPEQLRADQRQGRPGVQGRGLPQEQTLLHRDP
ncbi:unnamed protein product, partial [Gulo gulo]